MTRARDVADTQDNLGGAVPPITTGKNIVINGGFDFFQRGSFSTTGGGYGLDRWQTIASGSASATVLTQQTTGVPNGSRYCMRIAMGASGGYGNQFYLIETSNVAQLWGQTATFSVKIRRNATFAGSISIAVEKSATVDASMGASWSALKSSTATNANMPTGTGSANWLTISFQVTIPNDGTANSLRLQFGQSQVEASGAYWEIAQVQLESGSVATPFSRAGGSIGGELALCQRYYYRIGYNGAGASSTLYNYPFMGYAIGTSTTTARLQVPLPVFMRIPPTSIDVMAGANYVLDYGATAIGGPTALSIDTFGLTGFNTCPVTLTLASGLTNGFVYSVRSSFGSNAYIGVNAEL
jgi:hypothetical protein